MSESLSQRMSHLAEDYEQGGKTAAAERLWQLAKQEGAVADDAVFSTIASYVVDGIEPNDKDLLEKLDDIKERDSSGEWEAGQTVGQPIPKANQDS